MFLVIRYGEIIAAYRKLHLYDAFSARESDVVRPGDELPPIVDIDGWKIGVMTCYDVRFPETARSLAVRGADAIVVSAAWVRGPLKEQHWKLLNAARALENTCYVLACSEVSSRNIGCSRIINPMGEIVVSADDEGAELIATGLSRECLGFHTPDNAGSAESSFCRPTVVRLVESFRARCRRFDGILLSNITCRIIDAISGHRKSVIDVVGSDTYHGTHDCYCS